MIRRRVTPLCLCGCGMPVKWSIPKNKWNIYIKGHWSRGRIPSKDTKNKMRESAKKRGFFKEYNKTQTHREKVIKSNMSRKLSNETKQKIANTLKGFKHSEETKQKMKETKRNNPRVGEFAPNWQGGKQKYGERWHSSISSQIKERDGCCVYCGSTIKLQPHHIDLDKKNNDEFNLVTLCRKHHTNIHPRKNFLSGEALKINNEIAKEIKRKIKKYILSLKR